MLHHIKELIQKKLDSKAGKIGESETVFCGNKTGVKRAFHKADSRRQETRKNMTDPRGCRKAETATSLGRSMMEMPDTGIQQPIQQNQHGRSMVEMLGVLVIIGVLSIGALAGYRYGMDKHRANATMNDINLRGVDLVIQASRNIDLNLDEWSTTSTAGYTFGTPEHVADGFVKLSVSGLPERVCDMVVDGLSSQFDMDINGARIDENATCGEDNTIAVYFDATGPTDTDDACGGCPGAQTCIDGACVCTNGGTGENCEKDLCEDISCGECQECQEGACVTKVDYTPCPNGYCEMGFCISNENPTTGGSCTTSEDCGNSCMYCDDGLCLAKKEGTACGENGVCKKDSGVLDCVYPCSEDHPLKDSSGNCHSCDTRTSIYVGSAGDCTEVCPDRVLKDGSCILPDCPADRPLKDSYGYCYSCDTANSVYVSGVTGNCAVCDNRKLKGNYCILPECPMDKPLQDLRGACYSCDTTSDVYVWDAKGNCAVCDNRFVNGYNCVLPCPSDKPLMDKYGTCHSCDEEGPIFVNDVTENCNVCPERKLDGNYCVLK